MPRGTNLTVNELRIINKSVHQLKMRPTLVAKMLGRSVNAVWKAAKERRLTAAPKPKGRPSKVTEKMKRAIIRRAKVAGISAGKLKDRYNLPATRRRVAQILRADKDLACVKRDHCPPLRPRHKEARLKWAERCVSYGPRWKNVTFSDEKKFNLDGPDGMQKHWHYRLNEKQWFKTSNFRGKSVMVWAGFSYVGKTNLVYLKGNQKSQDYVKTLQDYMIPFADRNHQWGHVFQHDNASIHASKCTKSFLARSKVNVMDWPALSPDLNPMENVWSMTSSRVYENGKQHDTLDDLKKAIDRAYDHTKREWMEGLIKSMKQRCLDVVAHKGAKTKH